jgi:hypothetical protein
MVLTKEILDELFKLYDELDKYHELHSEQLKTVQDQFGSRKVSFERDGKVIEVAERTLWEEVRHLGIKSQAGEILKQRYPDVFDSFEKFEKCKEDTRIFVLKYMGLNFTQMTLGDYIKLTLGLIDYARNNPAATSTDDTNSAPEASGNGQAE